MKTRVKRSKWKKIKVLTIRNGGIKMGLKTKLLYAYRVYEHDENGKRNLNKFTTIPLDQAINEYLEENSINENNLVDIKFAPVGYFQESGEGEIESAALLIYKTKKEL
jgi:hypothetical protein